MKDTSQEMRLDAEWQIVNETVFDMFDDSSLHSFDMYDSNQHKLAAQFILDNLEIVIPKHYGEIPSTTFDDILGVIQDYKLRRMGR